MTDFSESIEDYLESIFVLGKNEQTVRAIDIAGYLDYSKPSVSVAMKNLREQGLIVVTDGSIQLTPEGAEIAARVYERHKLISDWLMYLGVDEKTALRDACKMEHGMSDSSYQALKRHVLDLMNV